MTGRSVSCKSVLDGALELPSPDVVLLRNLRDYADSVHELDRSFHSEEDNRRSRITGQSDRVTAELVLKPLLFLYICCAKSCLESAFIIRIALRPAQSCNDSKERSKILFEDPVLH